MNTEDENRKNLENQLLEAAFNYGANQYSFHKDDPNMVNLMNTARKIISMFNAGATVSHLKYSSKMIDMFQEEFTNLSVEAQEAKTEEEFAEMVNKINKMIMSKPFPEVELRYDAFLKGEYRDAEDELLLKVNRKGSTDEATLSERESKIFNDIAKNFTK